MENTVAKSFRVQLLDDISQMIRENQKQDHKIGVDDLKCELLQELQRWIKLTQKGRIDDQEEYFSFKMHYFELWESILGLYWDKITSRQIYALNHCIGTEAIMSPPAERRKILYRHLDDYIDLSDFDIPDTGEFIDFLVKMPLLLFYEFTEFIINCEDLIMGCELSQKSCLYTSPNYKDHESMADLFARLQELKNKNINLQL